MTLALAFFLLLVGFVSGVVSMFILASVASRPSSLPKRGGDHA